MKWVEMTSSAIGRVDPRVTVVLNIGAIEQHGPHLPVETDALIGRYFTEQLDKALGEDVIVLPQVAVCCSRHHMDFPGTLTVSHETLLAYVCDLLESVVHHGFKNIVILNSHGGNTGIAQVILEKFGMDHPEVEIFVMTWWQVARDAISVFQESAFGGVGHACEFETSLLLHLAPSLVRGEYINDQPPTFVHEWAANDLLHAPRASHHRTMHQLTNGTGTFGSPNLATAEKGARLASTVSAALVSMVRDITAAS